MMIHKWGRTAAALAAGLGMLVLAAGSEAVPVCATTGANAGHCYDSSTNQGKPASTWAAAQTAAGTVSFNGQPGHLATITSLTESLFIEANFAAFLAPQFGPWFGLFQSPTGVEPGTPAQGAAGGWQWVTTEPFYSGNTVIFENWFSGEPNNSGNEDFGHFFVSADAQGHQWNDLAGDAILPFLIEFEPAGTRVPEPATLLLLGAGLTGLAAVARRRRLRS